MSVLKHLKNAPKCFDHHSHHLQGARRFLVKVTEFKSVYELPEDDLNDDRNMFERF